MTKMTRVGVTAETLYNKIGWTYKKLVESEGREFKKTDNLRCQIRKVVEKMTSDDLRWCLLINGQIGNGKSTLSKAILSVFNDMIDKRVFNSGDIMDWHYMSRVSAMGLVEAFLDDRDKYKEYRSQNWLIVDDVGSEAPYVNLYGTVFRPMSDLLFYRYENRLPTIFVSNFRLEGDGTHENKGLFDIYDDPRFRDRFKQMFNVVLFKDKSFRL